MSSIAYALRAEHHDTYLGGVLAVGDDSLDIRQALQDGNGVIVVPDTDTIRVTVLDAYPPLQRVDVPQDGAPALPVGYIAPAAAGEESVPKPRRSRSAGDSEIPGDAQPATDATTEG
jgi:hypothetical protein